MLKPFRSTTKEHWLDAFYLHAWTLLGGLLPIWGGYFLSFFISKENSILNFIDHGELALYSAAIAATSCYVVAKDAPSGFPQRQSFLILLIIGLLLSTLIFSIVVFGTVRNEAILNKSFFRIITVIIFVFFILISFLISVLDNARTTPDVQNIRSDELRDLEDQFDKLK